VRSAVPGDAAKTSTKNFQQLLLAVSSLFAEISFARPTAKP